MSERTYKLLKADARDNRVRVPVVATHLRSQPVDFVTIPPLEALLLAEELTRAARIALNEVNDS